MLKDSHTVQIRNKGRYALHSRKVLGTTLSGDPIATTFGNSLKVSAYVSLLCANNIEPWHAFVAGDDVLIMAHPSDIPMMEWRLY